MNLKQCISLRLLSVLLSTLPHLKIPNYTDKQEKMIPSLKNSDIAKKIFKFTLKVWSISHLHVVGCDFGLY